MVSLLMMMAVLVNDPPKLEQAPAPRAKASSSPGIIVPTVWDRKEPVNYEKDVLPLFKAKCTVCHSGWQFEGGYNMDSGPAVLKGGKTGPAVIPGKAAESRLYLMSSHAKKPIMPPKSESNPVTPEELAVLKAWIDQGAKVPAIATPVVRAKVALNLPAILVKPVRAVAISPDKAKVAVARGTLIHLFDAKTGTFLKTLTDNQLKAADGKPVVAAHVSLVESLAYSPDGKTLASGSFREVTLWDTATDQPRARLTDFADKVVTLAFQPGGKLLATGGGAPTEEGEIKLFDTTTSKFVGEFKQAHSDTVFGLSFNPDGTLLAAASADKFVKVFNMASGKFLKAFEGHTQHVLDVGWTIDGARIVSAGADSVIKMWDYEKGEKTRDVQGVLKQVTRLVFVGKTNQFLVGGGDGQVRLYNNDGNSVRQYTGASDFIYAVAASDDGTIIVAGGEDGVARLYAGATGQLVKALVLPTAEPAQPDEKKK